MKARRAEEGRGFESLRYNAATQHVGFLLILIGAAIGLATPGDTRRNALARPYKSQGNDSGGAKCPCSLGGCEKLIAVWSPAAVLPPRPGLAVAACRAGNEAKITIRILA